MLKDLDIKQLKQDNNNIEENDDENKNDNYMLRNNDKILKITG